MGVRTVPAGAGAVARRAADVAWWAVTVACVALFGLSLPPHYRATVSLDEFGSFEQRATAAEAATALDRLGISPAVFAAATMISLVIFALGYWAVAVLIRWYRPDDRGAWLISMVLVTFGAGFPNTLDALSEVHPGLVLPGGVIGQAGFVGFTLLLYLFPDGRFVPRWTRWTAVAFAGALVLADISDAAMLAAGPVWFTTCFWLVIVGSLVAAPVIRYRRASLAQRQQLKWVLVGVSAAIVTFLVLAVLPSVIGALGTAGVAAVVYELVGVGVLSAALLMVPVTIGIAVLRHRLFDIDLVLSRTLTYVALSVAVLAVYVLVVGGMGALLSGRAGGVLSVLATGLVAALIMPLRTRLQRGVNRLVYGERDDPYAVLARLGDRLEASLDTGAVLPAVVDTVGSALKLPYVAVELAGTGGAAAVWGTPGAIVVRRPLTHAREAVGELLASPRSGQEGFSRADLRLLDDLARQAGAATHAVALTADLARARERLVTAREEERRRLRRDLHDGLGPQLSSQALTIDAVRATMRCDPETADALLIDLKAQAREAVTDIRRLVHGLRPPALDSLGLVGALRESAARCGADGLTVEVNVPGSLPPLSAAVEVASYRIAQEALANVVRHAQARRCFVRLSAEPSVLRLEIRDDGHGIGVGHGTGVGLWSHAGTNRRARGQPGRHIGAGSRHAGVRDAPAGRAGLRCCVWWWPTTTGGSATVCAPCWCRSRTPSSSARRRPDLRRSKQPMSSRRTSS